MENILKELATEMRSFIMKGVKQLEERLPNVGDEILVDTGYIGSWLTFPDTDGEVHMFAGIRRVGNNACCLLGYRDGEIYEEETADLCTGIPLLAKYAILKASDENCIREDGE